MTLAQSPGNCSLSVAEVDESISSAIYGRVGPRTNNLREIYIQARCPLWVISGQTPCQPDVRFTPMCGRLRVGKDFLERMQHWSVQPCVRPVCAVPMTAGHNALRGSGPDQ